MTTKNILIGLPAREKLAVGQDNEIYATFTFNPPAMEESERAVLDIAVATDVSGSMGGNKMEAVKQSLLKLVEHLKPTDRLALVTFTTHVETIFEPMLMTADNKAKAQRAIQNLRAQSMTNLSGGLFKALDYLKESDPIEGAVRRCLLFTDGIANEGISDPEKLAPAALEYRCGVGISTFGYGRDHHEKLLEAISQDGDFYFIDNPDKILTAFGAELGGLISTYAQNVVLTLTPGDGVKIAEVLNDLNVKDENGKVTIECDDLLAEQEYAVALRLDVEKRDNAHPRGVNLVKAEASYFDVSESKKVTIKGVLKAQFVAAGKETTKDNEAVMDVVALQKAVAAQAKAIKLADQGNYAGARQILVSSAGMLRGMDNARAMDFALVNDGLAEENFTEESYRSGGSSEVRSMNKGLRRRRSTAVRSKGGVDLGGLYGANKTQKDTVEQFEAQKEPVPQSDEEDAPAPPKKEDSSGVSKRRSGRSW